jgi:hypothetical protein
MIESDLVLITFGRAHANQATLDIDVLDGAFDETRARETGTNRLSAVTELENS